MATKVIYIAGVPASGKSALFKRIRESLFAEQRQFSHGALKGIYYREYRMLGIFDGTTFEGTDKLSMSVINDAIDYIQSLWCDKTRYVVFVEGDRLFNERFLRETRATLLLIDANEVILRQRHAQRADTQTETFLKGRRSKIENFAKKFNVKRIWNNTPADQDRIVNYILKTATDYVEAV